MAYVAEIGLYFGYLLKLYELQNYAHRREDEHLQLSSFTWE
jgi:hypothetical protein